MPLIIIAILIGYCCLLAIIGHLTGKKIVPFVVYIFIWTGAIIFVGLVLYGLFGDLVMNLISE